MVQQPFQTIARRPDRPVGKVVGMLLPALTKKAFERYGFPAAAILTDWPAIVGADLAAYTAPERLRWPKGQAEEGDETAAGKNLAAVLVLRVDGARSLDIQYRKAQLIDRINAYFGFRAVADLRIIQAPVTAAVAKAGARVRPPVPKPLSIDGVADEALRAALGKLGGNVAAAR